MTHPFQPVFYQSCNLCVNKLFYPFHEYGIRSSISIDNMLLITWLTHSKAICFNDNSVSVVVCKLSYHNITTTFHLLWRILNLLRKFLIDSGRNRNLLLITNIFFFFHCLEKHSFVLIFIVCLFDFCS